MKLSLPKTYPVTSHTDYVGPGSTFVVINGAKDHGLNYVKLAVEKGATKVVFDKNVTLEKDLYSFLSEAQVAIEFVSNTRKVVAKKAAKAWGYPALSLKLIGITGTKGKTSTAYLSYFLLKLHGHKVALLSTAEKLVDGQEVDLDLTTPLPEHLHAFFALCEQQKVEYVVMEISAQALSLHRVEGLEFVTGIFTNFSHEHLEFYESMDSYFAAKKMLIAQVQNQKNMFVNFDDEHGRKLMQEYPACRTYSLESGQADFHAQALVHPDCVTLKIVQAHEKIVLNAPLIGKFNASNLLGVVSMMTSLDIPMYKNLSLTQQLHQIPGRMEKYKLKNGSYCFIDYAHNPSSFEAVLSTLKSMTKHLIVVFGAGGCRDKSKRPMMGAVAEKYADVVVLTSDNPRDEDPAAIINDILEGFSVKDDAKIIKELNRTKSIELAYHISHKDSIIAILGKGRDEYQIVGRLTFPFKERSIIKPFMI